MLLSSSALRKGWAMPLDYDIDYSDEIAALPKHPNYTTLPARSGEQYVTIHYSGVVYPKTTRAGQLQRILDEARYQLGHNYGTVSDPAYPDGLLYDIVVLDDGIRVLTRSKRVQLWHVGNATGNRLSWAAHLMLGPNQDATEAQWAATVDVIEQLCAEFSIPRVNVVGHNEWPRRDGVPLPSATYKLLPEQSECPGKILHQRLADWRALPIDPLKARQIPGPHGTYFRCGTGFYDYYQQQGGFVEFGYPLANEQRVRGQDGRDGTMMPLERAVMKYIDGEGVHLALLSEAKAMGWL